ncbi:MAG TPA: PC4/YdbC family ssDNA-binding protein [Clostridia bacterium]|nr:PC4/YdbC family ssDNA-binding protein [Clostridia bacterium]
MAKIKYEIKEKLGTLSQNSRGWSKQLNLISWNDREAKYDLRDWAPENEKMSKGITLSPDELRSLKDLLNRLDI